MKEQKEKQGKDELPTAAYLCYDDGSAERNPHIQDQDMWGELVRREDIADYFEFRNLIDHLATAHRNLQRLDTGGDMEEAIEENERLQHKLEKFLEEVQNQ